MFWVWHCMHGTSKPRLTIVLMRFVGQVYALAVAYDFLFTDTQVNIVTLIYYHVIYSKISYIPFSFCFCDPNPFRSRFPALRYKNNVILYFMCSVILHFNSLLLSMTASNYFWIWILILFFFIFTVSFMFIVFWTYSSLCWWMVKW